MPFQQQLQNLGPELAHQPGVIRLSCVTYSPTRVLDGVKSLSYGANMLATRLARERGFDEALLVTPHGRVLEAPTSSVFWIEGEEIFTPPLADHILASITRALVIDPEGMPLTVMSDAPTQPMTEVSGAAHVNANPPRIGAQARSGSRATLRIGPCPMR